MQDRLRKEDTRKIEAEQDVYKSRKEQREKQKKAKKSIIRMAMI